jgi:hypothetical protein
MKKISKVLYWTPRILSIIFILFLAMFSLDIFDSCTNFLNCSGGLLIHNIPVFILIIILCFAWKREWIGAISFLAVGLFYILLLALNPTIEWFMISWAFTISGPSFLVAYLFWRNWKKRK